uniref:Uncharacterized protein n=1 Tax=Arundo donax TaxID=35708 RepID=A0A0A8Y933_ARUDO
MQKLFDEMGGSNHARRSAPAPPPSSP